MFTISTLILEAMPLWASLLAIFVTGGFVGGLGTLIGLWVNRGKPAAEIHASRAQAIRDLAEADEIRIRANFSLEEETIHRTQQMIRAQRHIFELQEKNRRLTEENEFLRGRKQIGGQG